MNSLQRLDEKLSLSVFSATQQSSVLKLLATIVTLTGDEALCYPVTSLVGFLLYYFATSPEEILVARRILRIYGDFGAVCLMEQGIKVTFKRSRPNFKERSKFYCMPGEQYSFPSGHSLRAFYGATIFLGPHSPLFIGTTPAPSLMLYLCCIGWAIGVAVSRVALSKHFCSDVVIGGMIGVAVALSPYPSWPATGIVRICLAATFTIEIITVMTSSKLRSEIQGWPFLLAIVVVFWITFPFAG